MCVWMRLNMHPHIETLARHIGVLPRLRSLVLFLEFPPDVAVIQGFAPALQSQ